MPRPRLDPLRLSFVASVVAFFIPLYACGGGGDDDTGGGSLPATANAARGALLYDQWWSEIGAPAPSTTHPAYPATAGVQTGRATWRCAECHGWDYKGAAGAYATGAHQTGIVGVLGAAKRTPQALFDAIQGIGTAHDFATKLGTADVWDLVAFVETAATETSPTIDATGAVRGDARAGGPLFTANCATCHGCDGGGVELEGGKGVGELAKSDPWRVLHAIRWGVAGTVMPSMWAEGLTDAAQADLLAYVRTLAVGAVTEPPPPPPPGTTISFAKDVHPIFRSRGCAGCHRGSAGMVLAGTPSEAYEQLFATGTRVDLATPSNSLVLRKPSMGGVAHGGGRIFACTSDADYQRILAWIKQGGLNN